MKYALPPLSDEEIAQLREVTRSTAWAVVQKIHLFGQENAKTACAVTRSNHAADFAFHPGAYAAFAWFAGMVRQACEEPEPAEPDEPDFLGPRAARQAGGGYEDTE